MRALQQKADPAKLTPAQVWALERFLQTTAGSISTLGIRYDVGRRLFKAALIERADGAKGSHDFGYYAEMRITEAGRNALWRRRNGADA